MFTGIIESAGIVREIKSVENNISFIIESDITPHLKVDESVSHNGICLTVEDIQGMRYQVTAVAETIRKTNAGEWKVNDIINLERAMILNSRLDGHIVQGHVDDVAVCIGKADMGGSVEFSFQYHEEFAPLMIEKGSVCLNGVSLTAFNVTKNSFTITIIPYTMEHTNFKQMEVNNKVNIEFDILGKYAQRSLLLKK